MKRIKLESLCQWKQLFILAVPVVMLMLLVTLIVQANESDTTRPTCSVTPITGVDTGPPTSITIKTQDTESGLSEIKVVNDRTTNFTVDIPSFGSGTTSEVIVTVTKINENEDANVELDVIDVAGNISKCEVDHFSDSDAQVGILFPESEEPINLFLTGPTAVFVDLSSLADTDDDGYEQVETELIQLDLMDGGINLKLRPDNMHPFNRSTGEIEENYNAGTGTLDLAPFVSKNDCPGSCTASSFFDVFFEVDVSSVGTFHNHETVRIEATIDHKPPGTETTYRKLVGEIVLYTESEDDSGFKLVTAEHSPTAIELISFTARANTDGSVSLNWETITEVDNAGFNLYRARLKDGRYKKINNTLILAHGNAVSGASYSYEDTPPTLGTYYYRLEDIDYNGASTMHGPVKVRVISGENASRRR